MSSLRNLEPFFTPEAVAVIGASTQVQKVGHAVFKNLISYGFKGKVYPVNPKVDTLLGKKCYPSVKAIEDKIDLAVISLPSHIVLQVLQECVEKNIYNIIIISAGFREIGSEGQRIEAEVSKFIKEHKLNVVGPNCLGLINVRNGLNASFSLGMPPAGNISFISQSGALCTGLIDWAQEENIGLCKIISIGNKIDLLEADFLNYLGEDVETEVIGLYIEEISNGREFMNVASEVARKKPIVAIKAGMTQAGAKAAASHTGSLAGSEKIYSAAFKQSGVILCNSVEEFFDTLRFFSFYGVVKGDKVGILTNAGGPGVLTADACERSGLLIPTLEASSIQKLREKLPPAAALNNPVDVLGDADSALYEFALDVILSDGNIDNIICLVTPQMMTNIKSFTEVIVNVIKKQSLLKEGLRKAVIPVFIGGKEMKIGRELLKENKIPHYLSPDAAVRSLKNSAKYNEIRKVTYKDKEHRAFALPEEKYELVKNILSCVKREGRVNLDEIEARRVISAYDIPVPPYGHARTVEEAKAVANKLGFPVVMKVLSPDILHKSDIGGVRLNLNNEDDVEDAFKFIMLQCYKYFPKAQIMGVSITKQVTLTGKELIIGMTRDKQFGPVVMAGLGGIYVEVLKDVSFRVAPLTLDDAEQMLEELRTYPLLTGIRGEKAVDLKAVKDVILKISQLGLDFPEILELDINPLFANEENTGAYAIDVKITVAK
jgi:acetyltransferase